MKRAALEINPLFAAALEELEHGKRHVFLTGKAGTGKSTLLRRFRETTMQRIAVVAPTGVAALNVEGETIHSFFRLKPGATLIEAFESGRKHAASDAGYASLDTVIIDEVSMVRADLLDCVDVFLRAARKRKTEPFGGVRMVFIGDLYQLPPVVKREEQETFVDRYATPYFFSADVMGKIASEPEQVAFFELEKIYRQADKRFIAILNAIRNGTADMTHLGALEERLDYDFDSDTHIHLTGTNARADAVNAVRLATLPGLPKSYQGIRSGEFPDRDLPTDETLTLKPKARVMFLANDSEDRWVNGTLGTIERLGESTVEVQIDGGDLVTVEMHAWSLFRSSYDRKTRNLGREELGSFTQLPLRLAWAVTIHKSQGKSFDRVVVDLENGAFATGQAYVALSRCRTLGGLILKRRIKPSDVRVDWRVAKFMEWFQPSVA